MYLITDLKWKKAITHLCSKPLALAERSEWSEPNAYQRAWPELIFRWLQAFETLSDLVWWWFLSVYWLIVRRTSWKRWRQERCRCRGRGSLCEDWARMLSQSLGNGLDQSRGTGGAWWVWWARVGGRPTRCVWWAAGTASASIRDWNWSPMLGVWRGIVPPPHKPR